MNGEPKNSENHLIANAPCSLFTVAWGAKLNLQSGIVFHLLTFAIA
jgi:hypothetical protein